MSSNNFIDKIEVCNPVELCKQLIQINSENPHTYEKNIAVFIQKLLKKYGIKHSIIISDKDRYNIIAELKGKTSKRLVFNGHLDTKPAGEGWLTNPFEPKLKRGRLYGLGASDMKGGVACILSALIHLKKGGIIPESNLELHFVADEEMNSEYGTKYLLKHKKIVKADLAIIAEPTGGRLIKRSLGNSWRRLKLYGKKAHAGHYNEGINAAYCQALFVHKMQELVKKFRYVNDVDYNAFPNFNIGSLTASGHPGTVTDFCELTYEIRYKLESERHKYDILTIKILNQLKQDFNLTYKLDEFGGGGIPPMNDSLLSANTVIKRKIKKIADMVDAGTKNSNVSSAWKGGCDGGYISLHTNTPSIIIGPGSLKQAHQPNEWTSTTELRKTFELFKRIMMEI